MRTYVIAFPELGISHPLPNLYFFEAFSHYFIVPERGEFQLPPFAARAVAIAQQQIRFSSAAN